MFPSPAVAVLQHDADRDKALNDIEPSDYDETGAYLQHLNDLDWLRNIGRDDANENQWLQDVAEGRASEWAVAYRDLMAAARDLKTLVVNLYALNTPPPFDVKQVIDCWPRTDPAVRESFAWLAHGCVTLQGKAQR